jgi:hypothetical protein
LADEALLGCNHGYKHSTTTGHWKHSSEVARGQSESGDVKTSAEELAALLRRVSEAPTREIEELINQLQKLRTQLHNAGHRIQRDIAQYTELSQQTI